MKIFADSATSFITERPDATDRRLAWSAFEAEGLPTTTDEVWRYAPLKDLMLDSFSVAEALNSAHEADWSYESLMAIARVPVPPLPAYQ
jgi:hypothetical protein